MADANQILLYVYKYYVFFLVVCDPARNNIPDRVYYSYHSTSVVW